MKNLKTLNEILNEIKVVDLIKKEKYEGIVDQKLNRQKSYIKNKRFTRKFINQLDDYYCRDKLFISITPQWGGSNVDWLRYLKKENNLAKQIADQQTHYGFNNYGLPYDRTSEKHKALEKYWDESDTADLKRICSLFSDSESAAFNYFSVKFLEDGRLDKIAREIVDYPINEQISVYSVIGIVEFHSFMNIIVSDANIPFGMVVKYDNMLQNDYVEYFHPVKYGAWNLYLPYSERIIGWYDYESPYRVNITNNITKNDALENLRDYCSFLEAVPSTKDIDNPVFTISQTKDGFLKWLEIPTNTYWRENFGELRFALIEAGIITTQNQNSKYGIYCIAKDGHNCRSMSEQIIDNFLYNNKIDHELEPCYPKDDILNPSGRLRADWLIDGNVYVEYFGLMQDINYIEKTEKKIALAKKYGIQLIEIYNINYLSESFSSFVKKEGT